MINAEIRLNPWIQKYRNEFFLSEKHLKEPRERHGDISISH